MINILWYKIKQKQEHNGRSNSLCIRVGCKNELILNLPLKIVWDVNSWQGYQVEKGTRTFGDLLRTI